MSCYDEYEGKDTRSTYPYSMCAGEAFHNSPGSESLGATGGDSGTWSMWGNNKIWKFTSENSLKHLDFDISTHENVSFHWICVCVCVCVVYMNAYCIEKNGVLEPWQLGWLAIRRWDFKPDTRRGFGIYNNNIYTVTYNGINIIMELLQYYFHILS